MRDDLVPEEVEVDPVVGAAAFRAAEEIAVEVPSGSKVIDGEGDMKGGETHTTMIRRGAGG